MTDALLTIDQISEVVGVHRDIVNRWVKTGVLRAIDVSENKARRPRWRIRQSDLDAFLASRSTTPPAPPAPRRRKATVPVYV